MAAILSMWDEIKDVQGNDQLPELPVYTYYSKNITDHSKGFYMRERRGDNM